MASLTLAGIDTSSISDALKIHYDSRRLKLKGYKNNPLLAMLPKFERWTGDTYDIPLWDSTDQGRGVTVSDAQSNKSDPNVAKFQLTRARNYATHDISREALMAAVGDPYAFLSSRAMMMDSAIHTLVRDTAMDLYKDGSGSRGTLASDPSGGTTGTLSNPEDIVNFEVGMTLEASATATGSTRAGTVTVTAVDRQAGTITTSANWDAGIAAIASGDHLFVQGDSADGGSVVKLVGLDAYVPTTAPSGSLFGLDQSVDTTRRGGIRVDGTSATIEEAVIEAGAVLFREGGSPDLCFMNPTHEGELVKSLHSKAEYDVVKSSDGVVGFDALRFRTPAGMVRVVSDPNCPIGRAYMLQMDTWKLVSLGPVPHLVDEDGSALLRASAEDSYEVRFAQYAQLGCYAPGHNAVITLATS